jgi:hypothetical protein
MEGRSFLRAFERREKILIWGNFYEGFERFPKGSCKRVSLSIGAPLGNLEWFVYREILREKGKYIWVPFLEPEDIKILSLGAIWNFCKRTVLL